MTLGPRLSCGNIRLAAWSTALGSVMLGGAGFLITGLAFAMRVVGGNGFVVLTGRYACGADA
jgi:hypothetical protein